MNNSKKYEKYVGLSFLLPFATLFLLISLEEKFKISKDESGLTIAVLFLNYFIFVTPALLITGLLIDRIWKNKPKRSAIKGYTLLTMSLIYTVFVILFILYK